MNEFITMLKIRSLCEKRKTCIKETGEGGIDKCPLYDPCARQWQRPAAIKAHMKSKTDFREFRV